MSFEMKRHMKKHGLMLAIILAFICTDAFGKNIRDTRHNLSVSGPGEITAAAESRICLFCHTTKRQRKDVPILWNRRIKPTHYKPYRSSTLAANVGQPTGASRVCLSCHDGTIALGAIISRRTEVPFKGGIRFIPGQRPSRLGTDLSDDHPVSFVYDSGLILQKGELVHPALLPSQVKLDETGQLQCTTCHNPHEDLHGKFLVMPNRHSALCTACHKEDGWDSSSHSLSDAQWNGNGMDPWPRTDYQTVAENGCENCHRSHSAGRHERLLHYSFEEDNCLVCHNGNVASTNIETEITKRHRHPVQDFNKVHDASESFIPGSVPKHVECEDCHNPHQANGATSPGGSIISGASKGVTGISGGGQQVDSSQSLYEICFKCHADNNVTKRMKITRQIDQLNTRLEFSPANPSLHPVGAPGLNFDVPSLLETLTINSIISCTDCHNTDNTTGPQGPHGSIYNYILERNYKTEDWTTENSDSYALCYKCHRRNSILNDESFSKHRQHIVDQRTPCSACHDPHGISDVQGNPVNNSHLINFDLTIVFPDDLDRLYFQDLGRFTGQCFLKCHGRVHDGEMYP
jgi:predicted CXXCH cytochrome family protein